MLPLNYFPNYNNHDNRPWTMKLPKNGYFHPAIRPRHRDPSCHKHQSSWWHQQSGHSATHKNPHWSCCQFLYPLLFFGRLKHRMRLKRLLTMWNLTRVILDSTRPAHDKKPILTSRLTACSPKCIWPKIEQMQMFPKSKRFPWLAHIGSASLLWGMPIQQCALTPACSIPGWRKHPDTWSGSVAIQRVQHGSQQRSPVFAPLIQKKASPSLNRSAQANSDFGAHAANAHSPSPIIMKPPPPFQRTCLSQSKITNVVTVAKSHKNNPSTCIHKIHNDHKWLASKKSARTARCKARVFPEALTTSQL